MWVLNDAHLSELGNDLASMHWGWVGAAVVGDLAVYFVHGWRWSLLLRALVPARFGQTVRATVKESTKPEDLKLSPDVVKPTAPSLEDVFVSLSKKREAELLNGKKN